MVSLGHVGSILVLMGLNACGGQRVDYTGHQVVEVEGPLNNNNIMFLNNKVEFWSNPRENSSSVVFLLNKRFRAQVRRYLKNEDILARVRLKNVQEQINQELERTNYVQLSSVDRIDHRGKFRKVSVQGDRMDWRRYHRLDTIYGWMKSLADENRDVMSVISIGHSAEGRHILAARIGSNSNPRKPGIFIEGGIHAREWISPASVTYIIKQLVLRPENRDLIDKFDFYIVPVLNPDGYEYTHNVDRMWRKNRARDDSFLNIITNCRGVDLNRNFGYKWGDVGILASPQHGTPLPCLETYMGKTAFSELETQAVRNFLLSHPGKFLAYLSFHSFGSKILYPWSSNAEKVPDWRELHDTANVMAEAIFHQSGGKDFYKIGQAPEIQYRATGGSDDWAKASGIKYVFLIELPGKGHAFLLPATWIKHVAKTSLAGLRAFAKHAEKKLRL